MLSSRLNLVSYVIDVSLREHPGLLWIVLVAGIFFAVRAHRHSFPLGAVQSCAELLVALLGVLVRLVFAAETDSFPVGQAVSAIEPTGTKQVRIDGFPLHTRHMLMIDHSIAEFSLDM
jgi:hypothetical protein